MPLDPDQTRRCALALVNLGAPTASADLAVVAWLDFLRIDPALTDDGTGDRLLIGGSRSASLAEAVRRLADARPGAGGISSFTSEGILGVAVGMAWGARANGSRTVAIAPAGDVFAGSPIQAAALAARSHLGNLVVLAADDGVDDRAEEASEQLAAAGWLVQSVAAHDPMQIAAALKRAQGRNRPSLIVGRFANRFAATSGAPAPIPEDVRSIFAARAAEVREWRRALREGEAAESVFGGPADAGDERPAATPFRPRQATTPIQLATEALRANARTVECPPVGSREQASLACGLALLGRTPLLSAPLERVDDLRPFLRQAARSGLSGVALLLEDGGAPAGCARWGGGVTSPRQPPFEDEALWSLRLIAGLTVWRPADGVEIAAACAAALDGRGPHVIALAANLHGAIYRPRPPAPGEIERGAYVAAEAATGDPTVVVLASGAELPDAMRAQTELEARGLATRVVSVPCAGRLAQWPAAQVRRLLGDSVTRIVLDPGPALPWRALLGGEAVMMGGRNDVAKRVTDRLHLEAPRREARAART